MLPCNVRSRPPSGERLRFSGVHFQPLAIVHASIRSTHPAWLAPVCFAHLYVVVLSRLLPSAESTVFPGVVSWFPARLIR